MAFGSATITRTKTKTSSTQPSRTQSKTKSRSTHLVRKPLLPASGSSSSSSSESEPPRPRLLPNPRRRASDDSTDESDDPDFGAEFRQATAREVQELNKVERGKQKRARLKAYRDRGEDPPTDLEEEVGKKASGKMGRDRNAVVDKLKKKDLRPEVAALLRGLVPGQGSLERREIKWSDKGKWKARDGGTESDEQDDGVSERPTKPTFDWAGKKKETEKRNRIKLDEAFFHASALRRPPAIPDQSRHAASKYDREQLLKHLGRRWVRKADPLAMSSERKELELMLNPLLQLLDAKITVVEDGEDMNDPNLGDSDSTSAAETDYSSSAGPETPRRKKNQTRAKAAKNGSRREENYVVRGVDTDDEDEDDRPTTDKPDFTEDDDTDWRSDGMGGASAHWTTKGRGGTRLGEPRTPSKTEYPEEEDTKPDVKRWFFDGDRGHEEPSTQDEGAISPRRSRKCDPVSNLQAPLGNTLVKVEEQEAAVHVKCEPSEDDDIEIIEPDTEPSDIEAIAVAPSFVRPERTVKVEAEAADWSREIKRQEELLQRRIGSQSQSQSQGQPSQVSVQPISIDDDGREAEEEDDEEDVDEQTLRMLKQQEARTRAIEEKQARQDRRERRKQEEEDFERARVKEEEDAIARRNRERREEEAVDAEMDDAEEEDVDFFEEPAAWEARTAADDGKPKVTLPYAVKKGRPKFVVQTLEQHRTGPHELDDDGAEIPASINKFLRPYQREGAEFLWAQWKKGLGGVLGDDMGLGKTIQVIAFLSAIMQKKGLSRYDADKRKNAINESETGVDSPTDLGPTCLIACPASVRNNWEREFQTWGYFDVAVYEGSKEQRARTMQRFNRGYVDVLIAGMESVRDQIEDFSRLDLTLVIVDEAHRLKSAKSALTEAFHKFPTPYRYGLTGTAIQNDLNEMWCILNFANPGHVGVLRQWEQLISRPLKMAQKKEASATELALGRSRASALVGILLPHFWLRRTKESVHLQLPRKRDNIVLCPLTDLQKDVYRRILALEDVKTILTADDPCPCGARDPEGLPYRRGSCCDQGWTKLIFKYIVLFQKISNHLALIYPDRSEQNVNADKYEQDLEWSKAAFPDDYQKRKPGRTAFADPQLCGKWKVLCELLEMWYKNGDKVLIFSMSLKVLELLSELMETTHYNYLVLDGKTPAETRMDLVDDFNDPNGDKFAFLISTRAGGVGLNLKAANKVVIFDPNWNPSHDLQAMDRSHRFGQTKEVDVFRLVGAGTLEELILNRQQYKRAQAGVGYDATSERRLYSGVQGEGKEFAGELFGVKNIFKFSEHISLTEKSIRQMELDELEYARTAEIDNGSTKLKKDGDSPPLDPDYNDEKNASGIVAEITGLKAKDETAKNLTPAQIERLQQHEEEQAKIASILGGRIMVQSDSVLGGSRVEEYRSLEAIKAATGIKSKGKARRSSLPLASSSSRAAGPPKRKTSSKVSRRDTGGDDDSDEDGDDAAKYDPLKRKRAKKSKLA